jgi:sec-independent protein translocase protein TatB
MFDINSGELVVIGVVALIAIGPKELPGVLRMVGQWVGKARRMAGEFQSQFQEAMREAEMADLKKSFDEVSEAARGVSTGNLMTATAKDIEETLKDSVAVAPPAPAEPTETASAVDAAAPIAPHDPVEGKTGS